MIYANFDDGLSKKLAVAAAVSLGTYLSYSGIQRWRTSIRMERDRESLRESRRQELKILAQTLSAGKGRDTAINEITNLSFDELRAKLQDGKLQAQDVLRAFQYKALELQEKTNCLTGTLKEADTIARELDSSPEKRGPLHGVPLSVKDSVTMKGYPNTWGCVGLTGLMQEDAVLLKVLRKQGAIPFVRTGIPQVLMAAESDNPIYGTMKNPHNPSRGPGGSSGGEGALIGGGGSIIGLGTDIAGSIRIPSAFCGVCGLKPGTGRVSNKTASKPRGQTVVLPTIGPMARDVDGIVTLMRCMLVPEMYELDPLIPPLPFREELYQSTAPLKIGYFDDDGDYKASPSAKRAVKAAKQALENAGHTLVRWKPYMTNRAVEYEFRALSGDRGASLRTVLKDDVIDHSMKLYLSTLFMSSIRRWFKTTFLRFLGQPKFAHFINSLRGAATVPEWFDFTVDAELYRREFTQHWKKSELDAVLGPAFAGVASKTGTANKLIRIGSWSMVYNVLDFPAGVLPVTRVNSTDISRLSTYEPEEMAEWIKEDLEDAEGMPVCVQVAALRWQEEICLRVMKDIEEGVEYQ